MRFLPLLIFAGALGCITRVPANQGDVAYLGPRRPPKPANCPVAFFLAEAPPYPVSEIASGRTMCEERQLCLDKLRAQACGAGAEIIYGVREGRDAYTAWTSLSAVFAVAANPAPPMPPFGACTPICSPGYACEAGTCVPECNPACRPGFVCGNERLCIAAPPDPAAPR